jgi:hypothetical protein
MESAGRSMTLPTGQIAPFDDIPGVWLRMAMHVHTTDSDGWLNPTMQRRYHSWGGFDVLAITDHDRFTPEPAGNDELLIIAGTEISLVAPKSRGPLHVLGIGITRQPEINETATLRDAARAIRACGGLPYLAHPVWSGLWTDEVDGTDECAGVEIFNGSSHMEQMRGHSDTHIDIWLTMGHRLQLIATDDTHYPGFDAFLAWVNIHAREKSREAVLEALAAGRFYATSGPRITELSVSEGVVSVRTTPVRSIAMLANPPFGAAINAGRQALAFRGQPLRTTDGQTYEGIADGDLLTGATFPWTPGMRFVRIVMTDEYGRMAWSNPIWAD